MKKIIKLFLALLVLISMVSCNNKKNNNLYSESIEKITENKIKNDLTNNIIVNNKILVEKYNLHDKINKFGEQLEYKNTFSINKIIELINQYPELKFRYINEESFFNSKDDIKQMIMNFQNKYYDENNQYNIVNYGFNSFYKYEDIKSYKLIDMKDNIYVIDRTNKYYPNILTDIEQEKIISEINNYDFNDNKDLNEILDYRENNKINLYFYGELIDDWHINKDKKAIFDEIRNICLKYYIPVNNIKQWFYFHRDLDNNLYICYDNNKHENIVYD